jgi:hypothetical protein
MAPLSHKTHNRKRNAHEQEEGEHVPNDASPHAVHPPYADETLREALRRIMLDPNIQGFDKKRAAAALIHQHLLERGALYRTADGRLFFFSHGECRLYDLEQLPFTRWLIEASGLSTTETVFNFALETLIAHVASHGTLVEVHTLSDYNVQSQVLTVSTGGSGVWRREPHGKWQAGKNGDDGILFVTEPDATPWEPDFTSTGNLDWLFQQINFSSAPLAVVAQQMFFNVWLLHQFFPALRRTRVIPAWLGPQGSGKSTTCRLIGRFLVGEAFEVTGLRKDKEDAFVAALTHRVVHAIDNADTRVSWLEDALARYATGEVFRLRQLYTTNTEVSYRPQAILMLTSRDPHFQRVDVAQRLLPLYLQELKAFQDEPSIFADLSRRRPGLWGELLKQLALVQDRLLTTPSPKLPFRMADYAAFGWRFLEAHGKGSIWIQLLQLLEAVQSRFATGGDALIQALGILMKGQGQIGPCSVRELHSRLEEIAEAHSLALPKTVAWLGRKLTGLKGMIETELQVVLIDRYGHEGKRWIALRKKMAP